MAIWKTCQFVFLQGSINFPFIPLLLQNTWCPIQWQYLVLPTSFSAGNGWFWQQNITQVRKLFITQSKLMVSWWNRKFLKAFYLLLLFRRKKIELHFGCGPCWLSFCPNRVLEEQFLTTLPVFFSELQYDNTSYKY